MNSARRLPGRRLMSSSLTRPQLIAIGLGLWLVFVCTTLRISDPYEFRLARELVFDAYQRAAPRDDRQVPVRVVDIDEDLLSRLGQWPWPRSELARLLQRIGDLGASAIAFDMVFPESDRLSPARVVQQPEVMAAFGGCSLV